MIDPMMPMDAGRTPGGAAVLIWGSADVAKSWSLGGLRPAEAHPTEARIEIFTGAGIAEAVEVLSQLDDSPRIWLAEDSAVDELAAQPSKQRAETLTRLVSGGCLLARSVEQLRRLAVMAPTKTCRMHLLPDHLGVWADNWLSFLAPDTPTIVLHDTRGTLGVSGALTLREDLGSLSPADVRLASWLPAAEDRRDEAGRIEPRLAAWYTNTAAEDHGADLLVLDRPEVAVALVRSPNAAIPLALSVEPGWFHQALAEDPVVARRAVRTISAGDCRVLAANDEERAALQEQGFSGSLRVVDAHSDEGRAGLQRLAETARPMAQLSEPRTLLLAGHDFKFAGELVELLQQIDGLQIETDSWPQQNRHSVEDSDALLATADIILCEFASHNAVWYSWHKRPEQRLVVRFHGYELFQDFVHDINLAAVDVMVFVSEFYRERVISELGWPREKTAVVHNMIDVFDLDRPKHHDARFHLGIAGIVPVLKRPDRALDLLEILIDSDDRYVLHVRGRAPWDYGWMWHDPVVQDAYRAFYERLAESPRLLGHVAFDAFGADMGAWFRRIGWMLSPSTRETFHLAPVEGMAGGAVPVVWQRDGADEIFDDAWIHASTDAAAASILRTNGSSSGREDETARARRWARRFDMVALSGAWGEVLFPDAAPGQDEPPQLEPRFDEQTLRRRWDEQATPAAFDRLMIGLLARPQTQERALEIADENQDQLPGLSACARRELEACRVRRTLRSGDVLRPPRTTGSAYLARPGVLLVVGPEEPISAADGDAEDAPRGEGLLRIAAGALGEVLETVIETPARRSALERIQIAADALTRRARVLRPQALCVDRTSVVASWAVLVAARRLGVPAVGMDGATSSGSAPALPAAQECAPAQEFDGLAADPSQLDQAAVQELQRRYDEEACTAGQLRLDQVTVGIISDEFTERTISERCAVVHIPRADAELTVAAESLDALFVESAWSGRDREWFHGVAYYKDSRRDIEQAVRIARARGIPVIFWNKEDPVHFRSFAPTAALCDVVFTTDADRIPAYLDNDAQGRHRAVASMPFFAEPRLHHPLPGSWAERRTVSYAGTYYGARYADRSAELDRILAAAEGHGLTIYDRQRIHPGSPYSFPERYEDSIAGGLSYDEVLEAYKAHPVHINVNSVNDSPTMFSRRVVEIAASGAVVVSGRGRGLVESLPVVPVSDDAEVLGLVMGECLADRRAWRRRAWQQLRAVRRSYAGQHALTIMLRAAGLPISMVPGQPWTAVVEQLDIATAQDLLRQTHRPCAVQVLSTDVATDALASIEAAGIDLVEEVHTAWATRWEPGRASTWAEDLLHAAEFIPPDVTRIGARRATAGEPGLMTWEEPEEPGVFVRQGQRDGRAISWLMDDDDDDEQEGMSHVR